VGDGPLFATGTFLWGLAAMCQLHRRPFAPELVLQQFPPPYSAASFQEAAGALNLRTGLRSVALAHFASVPAPFLAVLKPEPADDPAAANRLVMVLSAEKGDITCLAEAGSAPKVVPLVEFASEYTGLLVLCQSEVAPPPTDGEVKRPEFGFRWFVPELLRYKSIWRDVLAASLAIQVIALAAPLCTQVIIDKVVVHQTMNTLTVIAIALGIFLVFNAFLTWVRQYLVLHTGNRVDAVLGSRALEHLLSLPLRYFEHRSTGVLVARLNAVETIREFVTGAAVTVMLDIPFLLIFLALMFYYSSLLTAITLGVLTVMIAMSIAIVPAIRARLNRQFLLGARNAAFLTEYVSGIETVKSLQMEPQLRSRYGGFLAAYLAASFKSRQLSNTYSVAAHTLEQLLFFSVLCAGAWLVMQNTGFTVGMLVAYQMFASRLMQPMLRMVGLWQDLQQAVVAVQRLGDIMNAPEEPYTLVPSRSADTQPSIEINDLGFRYSEHAPYLYRGLNLHVEPGACIAILGPSGSGKSTLARLMQGFHVPTMGRIKIGGHDTQHLAANELRQCFGVVPQETTLFSGSVYENLVLPNAHASMEQVVQACRMAEIHSTIEALADGYQTVLGEHGVGLSGGQKQRIAIARALLKRPSILVFDEATSSLDDVTAKHLARTINQLRGRITIVVIAHRVPPGLKVDCVMDLAAIAGGESRTAAAGESA
jgi:ATP-binding cassette, subfamily B, bacterial HlyB/CyaB